jgi:hypothetical protein
MLFRRPLVAMCLGRLGPAIMTAAMVVLCPVAARASIVEYDFHATSTTGGLPLSYAPVLRVDSSVLSTGLSFDFDCTFMGPPCTLTGEMAGFMSLTDASPGFGNFDVDLAFPSNGLLSGSIFEQGLNQDLNESGTGLNWSGTLLSDAFLICGVQNVCTFEGYWLEKGTSVPEPSSVMLFGAALAALGLVGRRRGKNA